MGMIGASGLIYGLVVNDALKNFGHEVHVIITEGAKAVAKYEGGIDAIKMLEGTSFKIYNETDIEAPMASGSAKFDGMVIAQCSMRTLASVTNEFEDNLISRAAQVQLKEKKPLILLIRETPLSTIQLLNMLKSSISGAIVAPASPGFYGNPKTVDDLVNFQVGRILDLLGLENNFAKRWKGD
ncbi:MAG: UbiX family flavin prenyltransferase [Nitrososphaeria archaeon]